MRTYLLALSFFLIPYQVLGLNIYSSRLDLSSIIIFIWFCLWVPKKNLLFTFLTFILLFFYSYIFAILIENPFSITRIINASFFYSIIVNCLFIKKNLNQKELNYSKIAINFSLFLCLIIKILQPILPLVFENQGFKEASYSNLFYCSVLIYGLFNLLDKRFLLSNIFLIFASSFLLFLSRGLHFISLSITFFLILISLNFENIKYYLLKPKYLNKLTLFSLMAFIGFIPISYLIVTSDYFTQRILSVISTGSVEDASLSGLVWIGGFNQVKDAFLTCGFLGCGAGSPGVFTDRIFIPLVDNCRDCFNINLNFINRFDCYSLLFRSLVEFGFISLSFWLIVFKNIINYINRLFYINILRKNLGFTVFLFTFFIGSLIKEPHLYTSITFLPIIVLIINTNMFNINYLKNIINNELQN